MPRVLVIDDEPSIVRLVTAYLKPEGYDVHTASDGPSGLKAAHAFNPDIVILDIRMDGMDGLEVAQRIDAEYGRSRTKLVAISASVFAPAASACLTSSNELTLNCGYEGNHPIRTARICASSVCS